MRRFVIIGRRATASPAFSLVDLAGTSGRLDVLLRCVRAALLTSHGLRRDTVVYLVLLGGPDAPRTLRIDGARARFLRPDERSLATLVQKSLAAAPGDPAFVEVRPGVAVAQGGLEVVLAEVGASSAYVLDEGGEDVRAAPLAGDAVFFVGDQLGFEPQTRARLDALGARPIAIGPVSVHADDVVAIVGNELDRRAGPSA